MTWLPLLVQTVTAALLIVLTTYVCLRRPPSLMWPDLLILQLLELCFVVGDALTFHATGMVQLEIGLGFLYLGAISGPAWLFRVSTAMLLLREPRLEWPRTARKVAAVWACGASAIALTNPLHHAFLIPVLDGRNHYQPLWWFISLGGWALMAGSGVVFGHRLWLTLKNQVHDAAMGNSREAINAGLLLVASLLPVVGNAAWVAIPSLTFDPSASGLALSALLVTWGVYQTRIFEILPVSFKAVLDHDPDAIMIYSANHRIGYANPAAAILLAEATSIADPTGLSIDEVFDQLFDRTSGVQPLPSDDLSREAGPAAFTARDRFQRKLRLSSFSLNTARGRPVSAIRMRDITLDEARKRNRATAMNRLEQDLHRLVQPAIQSSDRALVLLGPATSRDRRLKEQVRTVRSTLGQLQGGIRAALELHLRGKSSATLLQQEQSSSSGTVVPPEIRR